MHRWENFNAVFRALVLFCAFERLQRERLPSVCRRLTTDATDERETKNARSQKYERERYHLMSFYVLIVFDLVCRCE